MIEFMADNLFFCFLMLIVFMGFIVFVGSQLKKESSLEDQIYNKGREHAMRGFSRDPDNREAYNDGYEDGLKRLNSANKTTG